MCRAHETSCLTQIYIVALQVSTACGEKGICGTNFATHVAAECERWSRKCGASVRLCSCSEIMVSDLRLEKQSCRQGACR